MDKQASDFNHKFVRVAEYNCSPEYYVLSAKESAEGGYDFRVVYNFTAQTAEEVVEGLNEFSIGACDVHIHSLDEVTEISKETFLENIEAKYQNCLSKIINIIEQ